MIRQGFLLAIFLILSAVIAGCSAPAAPVAPTVQVVAPSGPAATRTTVPVPPQPTSATLAPRTSVPFVSPTPAVIVPGGTPLASFAPAITGPASAPVGPVAAAPANPPAPVAAAPTSAPATSVAVAAAPTSAGPVPTAPGVATGRRSEVKFVFLTPLKPAEEAEPPELVQMRAELKKVPGFLEVSDIDDGVGALAGYDAGLITVEQLMAKFADLKHPVKRQ